MILITMLVLIILVCRLILVIIDIMLLLLIVVGVLVSNFLLRLLMLLYLNFFKYLVFKCKFMEFKPSCFRRLVYWYWWRLF